MFRGDVKQHCPSRCSPPLLLLDRSANTRRIHTAPITSAGSIPSTTLFFFFSLPSLSSSLSKGCMSVCVQATDRPIPFFSPPPLSPPISQTCVCVKWQNMDQVTEKGGRLGHLSGPGEGILKQKAAPGFSEAEGEQGSASAGPSPHRKLSPSLTCCRPMTCGHIPTRAHRFSTVS